jgi:hypothetical protein
MNVILANPVRFMGLFTGTTAILLAGHFVVTNTHKEAQVFRDISAISLRKSQNESDLETHRLKNESDIETRQRMKEIDTTALFHQLETASRYRRWW